MQIDVDNTVEVEIEKVAAPLAHENSVVQGEFFNQFATYLLIACDEDTQAAERQLQYMSKKLDAGGEKLITKLAKFVQLNHPEADNAS